MNAPPPLFPFVLIRGAGEMASAIAWRLYRANMTRLCMLELPEPLCVRRDVSFCPALDHVTATVEGVTAVSARRREDIEKAWQRRRIAVVPVADWDMIDGLAPDVIVDAILAKRNVATRKSDAPLVIALGPGFVAGRDCHAVIETNRGHHLGRIIVSGSAAPNTGIAGDIAGFTSARVLRAPAAGVFTTDRKIGDHVAKGDVIGDVGGTAVMAEIDGILRGLIKSGSTLPAGIKLGDIDPRDEAAFCDTISDKARAISGSVLESIMRFYNDESRTRR